MAFIANTAFELKVTNHEFDSTANISGYFGEIDAELGQFREMDCSAGILCKRVMLTANEGYAVSNGNTWNMRSATSTDLLNEPIYACNPHNVNTVTDARGNVYKIGSTTLGLGIPAGERDTFTRIDFLPGDRHYRFGIGNVSGTLGTNGFLTIGTDGLLTPAASAPATAGAVYFKVLGTGNFTEGAYNSFEYVDVEAHAVIA